MNSSIKKGLLGAAIATVLGTGAAQALPPSAPIDYTFYEAGGSAQENAAFYAIAQFLTSSSIDIYTDSTTGTASSNYLIVSGTTSAAGETALGLSNPANILFFYRFSGGSFPNGALPFTAGAGTTAATLPYPSVSSVTNSVSTGTASPATNPASPTYAFSTADNYTGNPESPDWGLTDVEVGIFNNTYNLNGTTALAASALANISQDSIYDDVFGVAVTNSLYALKSNFSKSEVAGILAGTVTNWNQLYGDNGVQLPSAPIWLLDRGSGSGSKAVGNQYFLDYPGGILNSNNQKPHSVSITGNVNGGYSGAGTGGSLSLTGGYQDVKESSNAQIVKDLNAVNVNTGTTYAVAILSAEFAPALNLGGGALQYSFAKINGTGIDSGTGSDNINGSSGTTYSNVIRGTYDLAYQNSFNIRQPSNTPQFSTTGLNAAFTTAVNGFLNQASVSGAHTGAGLPTSVPGVLLDADKYATQTAGSILWSRNKTSTNNEQFSIKATGTPVILSNDPL